MFVWLLVDIHSGMDQAWGYDKLLLSGWAAGSKRHSHHHQYGTKYYEPFFNWWDDAVTSKRWYASLQRYDFLSGFHMPSCPILAPLFLYSSPYPWIRISMIQIGHSSRIASTDLLNSINVNGA